MDPRGRGEAGDEESVNGRPADAPPRDLLYDERLYALFVGERWAPYYRERFARFTANGGRFVPTWNWAAALVPGWLLYRKLWSAAAAWAGLSVLLPIGVLALNTACGNKDAQQAASAPPREIQLAPSAPAQPQLNDAPAKVEAAPEPAKKAPAPKAVAKTPAPAPETRVVVTPPAPTPRVPALGPALPLFSERLLQDRLVERQIGNDLLQLAVLFAQLAQLPRFGRAEIAETLLPPVERLLADPVLAA